MQTRTQPLDTNVCSVYCVATRPEHVEQLRRSCVAGPLPVEPTRRIINEIVQLQDDRERLRAEIDELRPVIAHLRQHLSEMKRLLGN